MVHVYWIFLQCYNNLGQWSRLKNLALQSIDEDSPSDIGKIWDDVYLQVMLYYNNESNEQFVFHNVCAKHRSDKKFAKSFRISDQNASFRR